LDDKYKNAETGTFWHDLLRVRSVVSKALEIARANRKIGASLEAQVILEFEDNKLQSAMRSLGSDLAAFFITSQAKFKGETNGGPNSELLLSEVTEDGVTVLVLPADGTKCARCWKFVVTVGKNQEFPDICAECVEAISEPIAK
jgi:isoleucyl-tRNA synthetase